MKESVYKSYEELPLFLNARIVAQVLGIAPSSAYELMHESNFCDSPVIEMKMLKLAQSLETVKGFSSAAYHLGKAYQDGPGILPDDEKAEGWSGYASTTYVTHSQFWLCKTA